MIRNTILARDHLRIVRLIGESSKTALRIATKASPQKMLIINKGP